MQPLIKPGFPTLEGLYLSLRLFAIKLPLRLNYWRIYDNTFWVDETWSIRLARMTLPDMVKKTATDMHPPLYYMLAMAMNRLLGDNGPAYHLSALLPYVGVLFLACTEVRRQFGLGPAFLLVTMMSLMPEPLYYNVEVRMYSLGAFLVLLAYLALHRILTRNRLPEWVIFSLASLGAAYTHYYALIIVAFFYLILIVPSVHGGQTWQDARIYILLIVGKHIGIVAQHICQLSVESIDGICIVYGIEVKEYVWQYRKQ